MISITRCEKKLLFTLLAYSIIPAVGGLLRMLELVAGTHLGLPENPRALASPAAISVHAISSTIFCVIGATQFLPSLRRQHNRLHRVSGRLVAASGCLSAVTGLWMTHIFDFPEELQGCVLFVARLVVGLSMIALILWGVIAARLASHIQHGQCLLRAYALGLGASTQAFVGLGWLLLTGVEAQGSLRDGLMVFAWVMRIFKA